MFGNLMNLDCCRTVALLLISLASCGHVVEQSDYLYKTDTLAMQSVVIMPSLLMPTNMFVTDSSLVVYQRRGEKLFTIYPLPLGREGFAAGFAGRGPDDFVGVDARSFKPCPGGFSVADAGGIIKTVTIGAGHIRVTEQTRISTRGDLQNGMLELEDSYVNLNMSDEEKEFVLYDKHGDAPRFVTSYPKWPIKGSGSKLFIYLKQMVPHPSGKRFAAFYAYFRKFRIVDQNGNVEHEVSVQFPDDFPMLDANAAVKYLAYASYPFATSEYIAAICCNRGTDMSPALYTELQLWDWNGKLLHRIMLDKPMSIFTIDTVTSTLFGCNENEPDCIYTADLSLYL